MCERSNKMNLDFLKDILGADLFGQFVTKMEAYNGDEAHKDKQIKLANLTDGGYVSKDKYAALETSLNGKATELETANNLIADLKKNAGKDTELQQKITAYEAQIADLQAENKRLKCENALKFALIEAGATDVDYVFYKATEKLRAEGKVLELGNDDKVKGADSLITGLKTQLPGQFGGGPASTSEPRKVVEPNTLPASSKDKVVTRDQFLRMGYADRLALKQADPEMYQKVSH